MENSGCPNINGRRFVVNVVCGIRSCFLYRVWVGSREHSELLTYFLLLWRVPLQRKRTECRWNRVLPRRGFSVHQLGDFPCYGTGFFVLAREIFRLLRTNFFNSKMHFTCLIVAKRQYASQETRRWSCAINMIIELCPKIGLVFLLCILPKWPTVNRFWKIYIMIIPSPTNSAVFP